MAPLLLDHIILLLPHSTLHSLPPSLTTRLTITPGGTHADGLTQNKLITFLDGTYIELITFVPSADPDQKSQHDWGLKPPNSFIDFALTTKEDAHTLFSELSKRLEKAVVKGENGEVFEYDSPKEGARKREDGVQLKWYGIKPEKSTAVRGKVPFFCHDIPSTARPLRVPGEKENTTHPSGIYGVKRLSVMVSPDLVDALVEKYVAILGASPSPKLTEGRKGASFELGNVNQVSAGDNGVNKVILNICAPVKEWEKKRVEESGYAISLVLGNIEGSKLVESDLDLGPLTTSS